MTSIQHVLEVNGAAIIHVVAFVIGYLSCVSLFTLIRDSFDF
jgi:hypothetical protein